MDPVESPLRVIEAVRVPQVGQLRTTGEGWDPYQLIGPDGAIVDAVAVFFRDLRAAGKSPSTLSSYGFDLLRWFRFLWALEVPWNRATRIEARDFSCWLTTADKPVRAHWRRRGESPDIATDPSPAAPSRTTGSPNLITGKPAPSSKYARNTVRHSETVLRTFYDFHQQSGTGPIINPFPLDRSRRGGRANAHHNPMEVFRSDRVGLYRPKAVRRIPRNMPDEQFNEVFAKLPSHRDRALIAFYVSTGARAAELLGVEQGGADPGQQLITVIRKGTRAVQQLPASSDAFVWLRLYQVQIQGLIPQGRNQPLWWTLKRPFRPLTYHAIHRMFERVNDSLGSNWTLHDLRHTACYRMVDDPEVSLSDVQWVMGHAQLTTTQIYMTPRQETVVRRLLAHHAERVEKAARPIVPVPAPGYRPEDLEALFGRRAW